MRHWKPILALALAACTAPPPEPAPSPSPSPAEETAPAGPKIPLDELSLSVPVPDFLDEEQQLLYRQAYSLYIHLLGCESSGVEYSELYPRERPNETVELNGRTYLAAQGPFAAWKDFDTAIRAVFTEDFWEAQGKEEI